MIYEIAGLKVRMCPEYGFLLGQSEPYRSSGDPVLDIKPNPWDEARVRMETTSEEKREYICCSAAFCREILSFGRLFLHASAVVQEGEAYLFAGPSGTGKSTHTALWRQLFPKSFILNDDKPVIWPREDGIMVYGTPFAGKTSLQVNRAAPLKGICFLKQGSKNRIRQAAEEEAIAFLLNNTFRPKDNYRMNLLFNLIEQIVTQINIYEMTCTREPEAAQLAYQVMKGK